MVELQEAYYLQIMPPKVYIETTVVSYLTAWQSRDVIRLAHQQLTREWWETRRGAFDIYVSELVLREAGDGDAGAARDRLNALAGIPSLGITTEATRLAQALVHAGLLPEKAGSDHRSNKPVETAATNHLRCVPRKNSWARRMIPMTEPRKPMTDSIVAEVRKIRDKYAASFGYDLDRMVADLQHREREYGRHIVTFPPRRPSHAGIPHS